MRGEKSVTMNLRSAQQLDQQLAKTISELRSKRRSAESANAIARVATVRLQMSRHMFDIFKYAAKNGPKPAPALPAPKNGHRK